jgi:peroxiredoxin
VHCRHHALQLQRDRDRLAETGGDVVLVGMGRPEHARHFRAETGVDFPLLLSRDMAAYEAMDLERGSLAQVFSPGSVAKSLTRNLGIGVGRAKGGNLPLRAPQQDWHQLGGAFVIAPGGRVVYEHRAADPGDNPPTEELVGALEAARA